MRRPCARSSRTWSWRRGTATWTSAPSSRRRWSTSPGWSRHIRRTLHNRSQVTLHELCASEPLQQGLAELVAYLELADDEFETHVDEQSTDTVSWQGAGADGAPILRRARMPRVIFVR